MSIRSSLKQRAHDLQQETFVLYLAARHRDTPWYAKAFVAAVVAYALSPIDLIPDFIPVVGYLDDLILIPLGIALAVRMVPAAVLDECRAHAADAFSDGKPVSRIAGVVIVIVWIVLAALSVAWAFRLIGMAG